MSAAKRSKPIKAVDCRDVACAQIEEKGVKNVGMRILLGPKEGAENFVLRHFSLKKGGHTPYHAHNWEHEAYVLSGKGVVKGKNKKYPLVRGRALYIPPGQEHQFLNTGKMALEFLCIIPNPDKKAYMWLYSKHKK